MGVVSFLVKAHLYALAACLLYVGACFLLAHPEAQRHYLFLHNVRFPFFAKYDRPHARNFYITTADNVTIGAWHYLPDPVYRAHADDVSIESPELPHEVYEKALRDYPTFVYLHGNAMNRAAPFRVRAYKELANVMNANVVAIDYRGFGDSQSFPTEEGVVHDAYSAIEYVREHSLDPATGERPGLTIMGQSLGTGVAAQCALRMYRNGLHLDGLILLAAFKSIRPMVVEFKMGGLIPMLGFLDLLPNKEELINKLLKYEFNTIEALAELAEYHADPQMPPAPTLLFMHAEDDDVIPVYHGEDLYSRLEGVTKATEKGASFHVWSSNVPELGYVRAILNRSSKLPERRGLLPNARFVLPRNPVTAFVRLRKGGHNRLLEGNVDALQLMLPTNMKGSSESK